MILWYVYHTGRGRHSLCCYELPPGAPWCDVWCSALEAAFITGFNEKTVRAFKNDYFLNKGKFSDSTNGKYERFCLFNN